MHDGARHTRNWQISCMVTKIKGDEMAYFPFFFELSGKKILIIGGGKIALEKIERLLEFGPDIKVIAPEILPQIEENKNIKIEKRNYAPEDIFGADFVIAATDNEDVNRSVSDLCREKKIPINVVDDKDKCDFIFPSVIRRGDFVVGVTSSGASPQVAVTLRKEFEKQIPDNIEEVLDFLQSIRGEIKEKYSDASKRHRIFKAAADEALAKNRPLTDEELGAIVESINL